MQDATGEADQPQQTGRKRDAAYYLQLWQFEAGISCKELSALLGCAAWTVSALRVGRTKPGRTLAVTIERVTQGRVKVEDWDAA